MALSDLKIRKAQPKPKPYKLADVGGLFILVKPNGSKLWQQKYRHLGKERLLSHGRYPNVSLAEARNTFLLVAEEYLQMAYDRELADATIRKKTLACAHARSGASPSANSRNHGG